MKRYFSISIFFVFMIVCVVLGQEPVDLQMISQIKSEGIKNSQVMETLSYLTDVHGPRLTGSPNLKGASEWSRDKLTEWGLINANLESWGTFGRGWSAERFSIEMIEPYYSPITAYPKAWTPGTNGTVSGMPVMVDIESEEDFEEYKGKLNGAIVMASKTRETETSFEALAKRRSELVMSGRDASSRRGTLEHYTLDVLNQFITVVATAAILAYSLYTFTAPNLPENLAMMITIPFVVYGVFRYMYLVRVKNMGESPEDILITDAPLLIAIVLWLATAATILIMFRG